MDPGFPGSFERVFQQYDRIVSGRSPEPTEKPVAMEPAEMPTEMPTSNTPAPPPSAGMSGAEEIRQPPVPEPVPLEELVGFSDKPPWDDDPPMTVPAQSRGDRLAERMAEAERKINENWQIQMEHLLRLTKRALRRHMRILAAAITILILARNTYEGLRQRGTGMTILQRSRFLVI